MTPSVQPRSHQNPFELLSTNALFRTVMALVWAVLKPATVQDMPHCHTLKSSLLFRRNWLFCTTELSLRLPCMPSAWLSEAVMWVTVMLEPAILRPAPELWSNWLFSISTLFAPAYRPPL